MAAALQLRAEAAVLRGGAALGGGAAADVREQAARLRALACDLDALEQELGSEAAAEGEVAELARLRLELAWQLLAETSKAHAAARAVIAERAAASAPWRVQQAQLLAKYLEAAEMKARALGADCAADAYGSAAQRDELRAIDRDLSERAAATEAAIAAMEVRLEQVSHLPPELVSEFRRLEAAIDERSEYVTRLQR